MESLRIACILMLLLVLAISIAMSIGMIAFEPYSWRSVLCGLISLFLELWAFVAVASYAMS